MKKNVCIVGYGAIGPIHAEALSGMEDVTLYGICDIDKKRADTGASEYNCKVFYKLEDCLLDEKVDSIHICTPHYLHYEMIEKCLTAGKQVVIEKPITMKQEEFSELLSKYQGKPVYPVMQNRTNKCVTTLKEILDTDDGLGKLISVKGILTWHRDAKYYNSAAWRGTLNYEGGGILINQAVHTLDLMIYLAGNVTSVSATVSNKSLQGVIEVEDTVDVFMEFENGATGIFYATNAYGKNSKPQIELEFEHASFQYAGGELCRDKEFICRDDHKFSGKEYWGSGHGRMLYDLYSNQKAFMVEDIKNTMETMFAIYKSAETKTTQFIDHELTKNGR